MPVVFLEVPPGIRTDAKKDLVQKLNTAIEDVYPIGETLNFFREHPLDMMAENGGAPVGVSRDSGDRREDHEHLTMAGVCPPEAMAVVARSRRVSAGNTDKRRVPSS